VTGSEEFVRPSTLTPRGRHRGVRGQGYVEFALIASALILLTLGGVQLALIYNAALAVSQYSYAAARYASIHGTGQPASGYGSTLKSSVAPPPTICSSGFSGCASGAGLGTPTVTSSDASGNIVSGAELTVTVTYNLSTGGKIALRNPFFGVTFPTSLSNSTSMMAE
jgi:Flp pilus assembly protein TadG